MEDDLQDKEDRRLAMETEIREAARMRDESAGCARHAVAAARSTFSERCEVLLRECW